MSKSMAQSGQQFLNTARGRKKLPTLLYTNLTNCLCLGLHGPKPNQTIKVLHRQHFYKKKFDNNANHKTYVFCIVNLTSVDNRFFIKKSVQKTDLVYLNIATLLHLVSLYWLSMLILWNEDFSAMQC